MQTKAFEWLEIHNNTNTHERTRYGPVFILFVVWVTRRRKMMDGRKMYKCERNKTVLCRRDVEPQPTHAHTHTHTLTHTGIREEPCSSRKWLMNGRRRFNKNSSPTFKKKYTKKWNVNRCLQIPRCPHFPSFWIALANKRKCTNNSARFIAP